MNRFLIAHNAPRPKRGLSPAQERAIIRLLPSYGRVNYRSLKTQLGIPQGVTIPQLTRGQAWGLLNEMAGGMK